MARARENGVAVVQANRGMNMMVSKGEMVAYKWGMDRITVADVEVPVEISPANARPRKMPSLRHWIKISRLDISVIFPASNSVAGNQVFRRFPIEPRDTPRKA